MSNRSNNSLIAFEPRIMRIVTKDACGSGYENIDRDEVNSSKDYSFIRGGKVNCPKCGKGMEPGLLCMQSAWPYTMEWLDRRIEFGPQQEAVKRENLFEPSYFGFTQIEGFRCSTDCFVLLDYSKVHRM